ncbi:MAG: putative secretion system translation initiation factor [Rhodocyclales bacterium]|nr:putative secretion system translation initiation factor [Rhodocyclales bacterium]
MNPKIVRRVLGLGLLATLTAAYFAPPATQNDVVLSDKTRITSPTLLAGSNVTLQRGKPALPIDVLNIRSRRRDEESDVSKGIFAATEWTAPPLKMALEANAVAQNAVPSAPQAPPLPFRVLGKYIEDGQTVVFLQYNDQNLAVHVGDIIADSYKVESLNGQVLSLRYIPLDLQQTLDVGGTN